jgi:peptide/nickel transport system substrate-binding protein
MELLDLKRCAVAALGVALLAGCMKTTGGGINGRQHAWTRPHVLIYSDVGDINTLNSHLSQFEDNEYIYQLTDAWLIRYDRNNRPYPELCTQVPTKANGLVSKDGLTITFHLRKGVKWSDGAPFTAADVLFSVKAVLNPANDEVSRLGWDLIRKVDAPNAYTVVFHLSKPYSPFVETFFSSADANPSILPAHLLAKYPNINNVPYNSMPVGIGPFKVVRWERSREVVMKANQLYWRGRPKLDEIIYKIIPDRNTILAQLQSHAIDMWVNVAPNYFARASRVSGYRTLREPSYYWDHIDFNLTHPALQDPIVRRAMLYALDRKALIDKIDHGIGSISNSPTPPTAPYAVEDIPVTPFDIAKANRMLDHDGWKRGADGVRAKDGMRLSFVYATTTGTPDVDDMIAIEQQDWKKIGVEVTVRHYPAALMFAPVQMGGIIYGNGWDLVGFAWLNDAIGDYSFEYGCDAFPPNGQNDPRWCDPRAQAAMTELYSHYSQSKRDPDVARFVHVFAQDLPVMVEIQRQNLYVYNSDLKHFQPNQVTLFDNMMNVDI